MKNQIRELSEKDREKIEKEIVMLLHASRDCYRNTGKEAIAFLSTDAYYGEAFGIIRALVTLGYGDYGPVNIKTDPRNLTAWFEEIQKKVLKQENYKGNQECDYCLIRYGKDSAGRRLDFSHRDKYATLAAKISMEVAIATFRLDLQEGRITYDNR